MKLTWGRIARADLKYYLPGETYILKVVHCVTADKLHAKMSFRVTQSCQDVIINMRDII